MANDSDDPRREALRDVERGLIASQIQVVVMICGLTLLSGPASAWITIGIVFTVLLIWLYILAKLSHATTTLEIAIWRDRFEEIHDNWQSDE